MDEGEELSLSFVDSDGRLMRFEWRDDAPARLEIQVEGGNFVLTRAQAKRLLYWLEVAV